MCNVNYIDLHFINVNNDFLNGLKCLVNCQAKPSVPWCAWLLPTKKPTSNSEIDIRPGNTQLLLQGWAYCAVIGVLPATSDVLLPIRCKLGLSFLSLQNWLNKGKNAINFFLSRSIISFTPSDVNSSNTISSDILSLVVLKHMIYVCKASSWEESPYWHAGLCRVLKRLYIFWKHTVTHYGTVSANR